MAEAVAEKKSYKAVVLNFLKSNTMLIALVALVILVELMSGGAA